MDIPHIFLGDSRIDTEGLEKQLHENGVECKISLFPEMDPFPQIVWLRDLTVRRPDGWHFVGPGLSEEMQSVFSAIVPPSTWDFKHALANRTVSNTNSKKNPKEVSKLLDHLGMRSVEMNCVIDGGNIKFTRNRDRERVALVGYHSVISTMLGLYESNFFDDFPPPVKDPTEQSFYIARNWNRYETDKVLDKKDISKRAIAFGGHTELAHAVLTPISREDKETYKESAKQIQGMLYTAERLIEAFVVSKVCFLPQREMHIDLEVTPVNNTPHVLVHDDAGVDERLAAIFAQHRKNLVEQLERFKLNVIPVYGVAKTEDGEMNLMNSLQIGDAYVVETPPAPFARYFENFCKKVATLGRKVIRMPARDRIALCEGGLHCLSTKV